MPVANWIGVIGLVISLMALTVAIATLIRAAKKVDADELHRLAVELARAQKDIDWLKKNGPPG